MEVGCSFTSLRVAYMLLIRLSPYEGASCLFSFMTMNGTICFMVQTMAREAHTGVIALCTVAPFLVPLHADWQLGPILAEGFC